MLGNLLRAEFSRLLYRRRATYSLVLILALGLLAPAQWMPSTGPLTAQDHAWAQEGYQSCLEWEEFPDACVYDQFLRVPMDFPEVVSSLASSVLFILTTTSQVGLAGGTSMYSDDSDTDAANSRGPFM